MIRIGKLGFIRLIDKMPSNPLDASSGTLDAPIGKKHPVALKSREDLSVCDQAIVDAARISYAFKSPRDLSATDMERNSARDRQLLRYLMRHDHSSPFEMVEFKFHVKAPLFVMRQWYRHRTFSYNEISARYTEVKEQFYTPDDLRVQSSNNLQSSEGSLGNAGIITDFSDLCNNGRYPDYKKFIDADVPREQARMILQQNMMSEFFVKGNLSNWLRFVRLRASSDAQKEIRDYAVRIAEILEAECPVTMEAFRDYVLNAVTLTGPEISALQDHQTIHGSKGEKADFKKKMKTLGLSIPEE